MLNPVALQGTEVIPVAQFAEQLLEDRPVAIAARGPELAFEMPLEVGLNVVVIEQRVVHIDEEHGRVGCDHKENSSKYRIRQPGASSPCAPILRYRTGFCIPRLRTVLC